MTDLHEIRSKANLITEKGLSMANDATLVHVAFRDLEAELKIAMAAERKKSKGKTIQDREDDAILANLDLIRQEAKAKGRKEGFKLKADLLDRSLSSLSSLLSSIKEEMRLTS